MKKKTLHVFLILVFAVLLFVRAPASASAQTSPTPTPQPTLLVSDGNTFTFAQLDANEITLFGPDDAYTLLFGLPANWKLTGSAEVNLVMTTSFYSYAGSGAVASQTLGGFLTVRLNRVLLGVIPLNEIGNIEHSLSIPVEALKTFRADGQMELEISLNSGLSCLIDQQMNVQIQQTSRFSLPHEETRPDTDLVNFPRPLYQASIFPDEALIVVPDEPTAAELQSALTVSAGLGSLTKGNLILDMTTASALTLEQMSATHIIFVGQSASLPILGELASPLALAGGIYPLDESVQDAGVVQMVNSPWNDAKAVLIVSGNSDDAVVKAAQAVSTGVLRPNRAANLALVESVDDVVVPVTKPVDQTLLDLGYESALFEGKGFDSAVYTFYVPYGAVISPDAYFELVYGHSSLLDYDRSGIVVLVNGQPIGSVRMDDVSAEKAMNRKAFDIPPSILLPGNNVLEVEFNLQPIDPCSVPNLRGLWLNLWDASLLHLPASENFLNVPTRLDLGAYPNPYVLDAALDSTAFVLQRDNIASWRSAIRIANFLGDSAQGKITTLSAFYADDFPQEMRGNYHLVMLGLPSQMPIVAEMNKALPAPFAADSDIALESNMQVTFDIPPNIPLGYVELLASPWNNERVVIAALGNSTQGVAWASDALVSRALRKLLAGNFAVVDAQRILTTDTRLTLLGEPSGADEPPVATPQPGLPETNLPSAGATGPKWLPTALAVSSALTLTILISIFYIGWAKDRKRTRVDRGSSFVLVAIKEWWAQLRGRSKLD